MLIVKNIEIIEVERDPWELLSMTAPYQAIEVFNPGKNVPEFIDTNVFREMVQGQRFRRPDGEELVIGCSRQAEEIIGIQYESWGNMSREWEATRTQLRKAEKELADIRQMTFWMRLKALFKGIK